EYGVGLRARGRKRAEKRRTLIAKNLEGAERIFFRRSGAPLRGLRGIEGRRLDDLRIMDLFRGFAGRGQKSRRSAYSRPAGETRRSARMGMGLAGEPARDVQSRFRRSGGKTVERKEEVGVVGRGGEEVGRLRCAGLHRHQTA